MKFFQRRIFTGLEIIVAMLIGFIYGKGSTFSAIVTSLIFLLVVIFASEYADSKHKNRRA